MCIVKSTATAQRFCELFFFVWTTSSAFWAGRSPTSTDYSLCGYFHGGSFPSHLLLRAGEGGMPQRSRILASRWCFDTGRTVRDPRYMHTHPQEGRCLLRVLGSWCLSSSRGSSENQAQLHRSQPVSPRCSGCFSFFCLLQSFACSAASFGGCAVDLRSTPLACTVAAAHGVLILSIGSAGRYGI